jgi:hypothetical protein
VRLQETADKLSKKNFYNFLVVFFLMSLSQIKFQRIQTQHLLQLMRDKLSELIEDKALLETLNCILEIALGNVPDS